MSWAAHELESYVLQKHIKTKVSFLAILLGCFWPDMISKGTVYGFDAFGFSFHPENPDLYHRGWPGVGFTHSLLYGVVISLIVLWVFKSRAWALGLLIGHWAHVFTDICDSVGVMLFFPFSTQNYSIGMWAYAAQQGRYGDASAYYSSLGGVWDLFWLGMVLLSWKVLTRNYFFTKVVADDPVWPWFKRRLKMSEVLMLALYRAYFLYGACRIFAWFFWSRFVDKAPLDLSWGGPYWVEKVHAKYLPIGELLLRSTLGAAGLAASMWVLWMVVGRRLWARAGKHEKARALANAKRASQVPRQTSGRDMAGAKGQ